MAFETSAARELIVDSSEPSCNKTTRDVHVQVQPPYMYTYKPK